MAKGSSKKPSPEEAWQAFLNYGEVGAEDILPPLQRRVAFVARHVFGLLPAEPRCKWCNAPFHGVGAPVMKMLGKRQSTMNPNMCNVCEIWSAANIGGAEVEMSMLFADVRGSTTLAEGMSPAEFSQIISRFYKVSTNTLVRADALIDKLIGDEVAAFFVRGVAGPQFARRAVEAAQDLLRATGHGSKDGPWLPVGAGVHTGIAFMGSVGSSDGMVDITALGDAVNTAARLASQAAAGEVVVSKATMQAAGMDTDGLEQRKLELKGRSEPVDVSIFKLG